MIPLVSHAHELERQKAVLEAEAQEVLEERQMEIDYQCGTMIEVPRAALTADEIEIQRDAEIERRRIDQVIDVDCPATDVHQGGVCEREVDLSRTVGNEPGDLEDRFTRVCFHDTPSDYLAIMADSILGSAQCTGTQ